MKKFISLVIVVFIIISFANIQVFATPVGDEYISQLSEVIAEYDDGNYFQTISVTIGEKNIVVDGENIPIDEQGTTAYIDSGRTLMPVRKLAEVVGADVNFDNENQVITIQNEEKEVKLTIGEDTMTVNEESVSLLKAPEIKNDRTMLPVRDVAEALDCEVEWDEDSETAIFTRPLQTKRLIVFDEKFDAGNATEIIKGNGFTVLQFETISDTTRFIEEHPQLTIEPDYIQSAEAMSWGISNIGSEGYYNQVKSRAGSAVVAVLDSGIDYSHSFFKNRIVEGYDVINNDNYCEDDGGHGSHVASTVLDVAGYNSNIKIMPIKVFGTSDTTPSTIVAAGIDYAISHGANVINLSLGGRFHCEIEQQAINRAVKNNVAVIASAGNDGIDISKNDFSPGGLDNVITVSAIDKNENFASFSNFGYGVVDFAAPGVSIKGVKAGGGYVTMGGTSMAAPHVAGVYALFISANNGASINDVTSSLKSVAKSKNDTAKYGAGIIRMTNLEKTPTVPEPEPEDSTLYINLKSYPTGDLEKGRSYTLSGRIKSNYHITDVNSYILDSNNNVVQSASGWTTTKTYVIENSALDTGLKFNKLSAGKYYIKFTASDESGKNVKWTSDVFRVVEKEVKQPVPEPTPQPQPEPVKPPVENGETGIVLIPENFENLYIRTGPSTNYEILGHMDHTNKCTVFPSKTKNGWYYVKFGNVEGYAAGNYIYIKSETRTGTINIPSSWENLSIRTGPSTNYRIIGSMNHGVTCTVYPDKTSNGWYYVEYNGIFGYASGKQIDLR